MTRTAFFTALGVFACGVVFGAPRPENTTYVDGNVGALKPNTGGTLVFTDESSIQFKTGLAEVSVPYSGIRRAELGATQVHTHDAPAYKVWTLPQRLHKTETQLLTLEFMNAQNEDRTMTLELAKPAATSVLATIKGHTAPEAKLEAKAAAPEAKVVAAEAAPKSAKPADAAWWGDSYWKTNRNVEKWDGAVAAGSK